MVYDSVFKVQFVAVSFSLRQLVQFIILASTCQELFLIFFKFFFIDYFQATA